MNPTQPNPENNDSKSFSSPDSNPGNTASEPNRFNDSQPAQPLSPSYQQRQSFEQSPQNTSMENAPTGTQFNSGPAPDPTYSQSLGQSQIQNSQNFPPTSAVNSGYQNTYNSDPTPLSAYNDLGLITPDYPPQTNPRFSRKKLHFIIVSIVLLILLAIGGVFGLYLPNTPENVYNTGITRTGKTLDEFIVGSLDEKEINTLKSVEFNGSLHVEVNDAEFDGSFSSKYDEKQSDSQISYSTESKDKKSQDFTIQILSDLPDKQDFPDMFFKVNGLKTLGLDQYLPQLVQYDNRWISVTGEYLKSLSGSTKQADPKKDNKLSDEDTAELVTIVSSKTREYIFSVDPKKAVLTQKKFVGTEKVSDKITANHYQMSINKDNAKKYCKDLVESVMAARAYDKIPGVDPKNKKEDKETAIKGCDNMIDDSAKESETFDLWIDKKYKLIHKVRISEKNDKNTYYELGQSYTEGDVFPVFVNFHSEKDKYDGRMDIDVNVKTDTTKGKLTFKGGAETKYSIVANLESKPYKQDVKITRPVNPVPLQEILNLFGLASSSLTPATGSSSSSSSLSPLSANQTKSADVERQTDIKAVQGQLEAFYAQNGYYPTRSNLGTTSWRAENMKGLDSEALIDPDRTVAAVVSTPTKGYYAYMPSECDTDIGGCYAYELAATLSTGKLYTVRSLN